MLRRLALLVFAIVAVAAATLLPSAVVGPLRSEAFGLVDAVGVTADWGDLELVANAALFVPLGATLALVAGRRWWWTAVPVAALCSLLVESAQLSTPGRVPDPVDVVCNTAGAAVGAAVVAGGLAVANLVRARAAPRSR